MALHGEIKVNHREIARWSAVRKGKVSGTEDSHYYHITVEGNDEENEPYEVHYNKLAHSYKDGALVLTAKVMTFAHSIIGGTGEQETLQERPSRPAQC